MKEEIQISKFLSYVLRHNPAAIGIALDSEGWAQINELIIGAKAIGRRLTPEIIHSIV